jgi:hypothetical protein
MEICASDSRDRAETLCVSIQPRARLGRVGLTISTSQQQYYIINEVSKWKSEQQIRYPEELKGIGKRIEWAIRNEMVDTTKGALRIQTTETRQNCLLFLIMLLSTTSGSLTLLVIFLRADRQGQAV